MEYMRFFHNPNHYPTLEAVKTFLGSQSSGDGFAVLSTAIYQKLYAVALPPQVENLPEHPLPPQYYAEP